MNKMEMEMEVATEPIRLSERTKEIEQYKQTLLSNAERTQVLFNAIHRLYPIDSVASIPIDSDGVIMKLWLQRNKIAKEMHAITPLNLDEVTLPDDLKELRFLFGSWTNCHHKEMTSYLLFDSKNGYSLNRAMLKKEIDAFTLKNQVWISEPDQLVRYKISSDMLRGVNYEAKRSGFDFNQDGVRISMLKNILARNPFISYIGFKLDGTGNRFDLNHEYILTGKLI